MSQLNELIADFKILERLIQASTIPKNLKRGLLTFLMRASQDKNLLRN